MAAFVLGLAEAASGGIAPSVTVLLENTAGSGAHIGCRLEELQMIRTLAARETDLKIGYCLDTCHLLAAGFDIANEPGLSKTREAEGILGMENVKVIHANDSKRRLGSHLDRHANIGEGHIGAEGFRRILAHPELRTKPFILETPKEDEGDARRNIEILKSLSADQAKSAPTRRVKPGSRSGASKTSVS